MRIVYSILVFIAWIFLWACARESTPMGGPKDDTPPVILNSNPANESLRIKPQEITMDFSEFIKIDNANKQLIVTPRIDKQELEILAIKNRVRIKLNQELEDNTTYVFNFQQSVKDITESNPAENLKLVFSTGDEIDSLQFSGRARFLFPEKDKIIKDVLIGLYEVADTTDIFTDSPYYIAQADTAGRFNITNIKAGTYRAYAWKDINNSLKAESKTEPYAYFPEPVVIDQNIEDAHFNIFPGDLTYFKVNRSSASGTNFDMVLSKPPVQIEIDHPDINNELFYRVSDRTIRLYHTSIRDDSTEVRLNIRDSVGFVIDTTLYATFEESTRNKEKLEITVDSGKGFVNNLRALLTFNKPLSEVYFDSLMIRYDTAGVIPITKQNISLLDSADFTKLQITVPVADTLRAGTFTVYAADSTFRDIEGLYNETKLEANYKKIKTESLTDEISGIVNTDELPIIVQLLNRRNEVIKEVYLTESNKFSLTDIEAGDYLLRAIVDRNGNRRWDPGNFVDNTLPEPVYYYLNPTNQSREFVLKAGWSNTALNINPIRETGLPSPEEIPKLDIEIPEFVVPEENN
ncbi:MAG TPA: Ig-like domain-containing domain [Anditalea sp.]|nr:Ig-like domain-containing domain [Anditalea sp.]